MVIILYNAFSLAYRGILYSVAGKITGFYQFGLENQYLDEVSVSLN